MYNQGPLYYCPHTNIDFGNVPYQKSGCFMIQHNFTNFCTYNWMNSNKTKGLNSYADPNGKRYIPYRAYYLSNRKQYDCSYQRYVLLLFFFCFILMYSLDLANIQVKTKM